MHAIMQYARPQGNVILGVIDSHPGATRSNLEGLAWRRAMIFSLPTQQRSVSRDKSQGAEYARRSW